MKKWMFLFVLTVLPAFPGLSSAEEENKDKKIVSTMDEVVVTATKTEEKRKDIPNSLILMDEMDIEESSATSLGELLANELGIDWRTSGNYGGASQEIHIRGMSGNGTQVLVNGVSVNSPSLGVADVSRIPLNNIERIEVVKGSGSLLYGSGAVGGTINIITKRPEKEKMDLKVSAGYGSEDTYELSAEHGMFVFGPFGYYLAANYRDTDGFRDNGDLEHKDVSLKLVMDKGDILDISFYGDYVDREYGRPGVKPPKETKEFIIGGEKFYNRESASLLDRGGDEDSRLVFEVKSQPINWLGLRARGDYSTMENYNYMRTTAGGTGSKTWVVNEVYGAEGNVDIKPFEGASLLLGLEYKEYNWKSENVRLNATGTVVPGSCVRAREGLHTTGSFVEAQYRPCMYFKALSGIRYEDHSEFGSEALPRFGVVINPEENTALKLNTGKHFLAPTPNDLFWPFDDWGWGMGAEGNRTLKPEEGWHSDITLEQSFLSNKIFLSGSFFKWDMDNRILWADDGTGIWRPTNLKSYKADGVELGARIGEFSGFSLNLNYTYLDAEEKAEEYSRSAFVPSKTWRTHRATYSPEHLFKACLCYKTTFGMTASATVRYVSDRLFYRNETTNWVDYKTVVYTLGSYWTADVKLEQRLYDHWVLSLRGNNLFDEEYDTYLQTFTNAGTGVTSVEGYPGAGRSVFFRATFEY